MAVQILQYLMFLNEAFGSQAQITSSIQEGTQLNTLLHLYIYIGNFRGGV